MVLAWLAAPTIAHAAFPGVDGRIAFAAQAGFGENTDIYSINPDGTGRLQLTTDPARDALPAWSPDGTRLAFVSERDGNTEVYLMNADGSQETRLTNDPAFDEDPAWSPDGSRIAFTSTRDGDRDVYTLDPDGTNIERLTNDVGADFRPAWSPDGRRIAFATGHINLIDADGGNPDQLTFGAAAAGSCAFIDHYGDDWPNWAPTGAQLAFRFAADFDGDYCSEIRKINVDGSGETVLEAAGETGSTDAFHRPAWAPSGSRIVYGSFTLITMNPDGTASAPVGGMTGLCCVREPDWQPIIRKEFPRPKGATPVRTALVPAFNACTAPNRTHAPPLGYPSCNPPTPQSSNLTIGTTDANGAAANFGAFLRFDTVVGNPTTPADEADVRITMRAADIRCGAGAHPSACGASNSAGGADYTGELAGVVSLRLTDEHNAPFPDPVTGVGPGTVQDDALSFAAPCAQTPSTAIGGACGIDTTADALVPGLVREKDRALWQLGQVLVFDGGPDGDSSTPSDTNIFLTQGVFVP